MLVKLISFSQALAIVQDCDEKGVPKPFSVTFSTADPERGTGGEIITYDRAVWHVAGGRKRDDDQPVDGRKTRGNGKKKWRRNIRGVNSDQIRSLHAHLILIINGQEVR